MNSQESNTNGELDYLFVEEEYVCEFDYSKPVIVKTDTNQFVDIVGFRCVHCNITTWMIEEELKHERIYCPAVDPRV